MSKYAKSYGLGFIRLPHARRLDADIDAKLAALRQHSSNDQGSSSSIPEADDQPLELAGRPIPNEEQVIGLLQSIVSHPDHPVPIDDADLLLASAEHLGRAPEDDVQRFRTLTLRIIGSVTNIVDRIDDLSYPPFEDPQELLNEYRTLTASWELLEGSLPLSPATLRLSRRVTSAEDRIRDYFPVVSDRTSTTEGTLGTPAGGRPRRLIRNAKIKRYTTPGRVYIDPVRARVKLGSTDGPSPIVKSPNDSYQEELVRTMLREIEDFADGPFSDLNELAYELDRWLTHWGGVPENLPSTTTNQEALARLNVALDKLRFTTDQASRRHNAEVADHIRERLSGLSQAVADVTDRP